MHLQAYLAAVEDRRHIGRDHGADPCRLSGIQRLIGLLEILRIEYDIERQIGPYPVFTTFPDDVAKFLWLEIVGRM